MTNICNLCGQRSTMFTIVQQPCIYYVINKCKHFAKNDYFELNGILYSFAAESA